MSDIVSKETRSKMMSSIKSVSKLENRVASSLWRKGLRFRRNTKGLMGRPDISIKKYKIVIFIDSCFWHGCSIHANKPKNNAEFWANKLEGNKRRDQAVNEFYSNNDWNILRVWEHEFKTDYDNTINNIYKYIVHARRRKR